MCNITLTRRRGSRPDGTRYYSVVIYQFGCGIIKFIKILNDIHYIMVKALPVAIVTLFTSIQLLLLQ